MRKHTPGQSGTSSEIGRLVQKAEDKTMLAVKIRKPLGVSGPGLVIPEKVQVERRDAPGSAGEVHGLGKGVAGQKVEDVTHPLGDTRLQRIVVCIERGLTNVRSSSKPLEWNSLRNVFVGCCRLSVHRILRCSDECLVVFHTASEVCRF